MVGIAALFPIAVSLGADVGVSRGLIIIENDVGKLLEAGNIHVRRRSKQRYRIQIREVPQNAVVDFVTARHAERNIQNHRWAERVSFVECEQMGCVFSRSGGEVVGHVPKGLKALKRPQSCEYLALKRLRSLKR